jgi:PKHD-type hydroxylase
MLVHIRNVLTEAQLRECRAALDNADWTDGRATAGYLSQRVKNNAQLPETSPTARRLGNLILDALDGNATFLSAALPKKIVPPLFNRYEGSQSYGAHIDGAIRPVPGTPHRVRTDLSATLFLSEPESYDGGGLVIGDSGEAIRYPAGDMLLYPGSTIHHVAPVTRGSRLASFFWIESMVREDSRRQMLFELDNVVQELGREKADHPQAVKLAGLYHNLLREWADT